jgi:phenylalanyl-tRNA synthetase beta chain
MRIPLSWLRDFVDVPVEAPRLGEDLTLAGLELGAIEGEGPDAILDFDITTNRVDCMNVYGVAREVSVLYDAPLRPLDLDFTEAGAPASRALAVDVEASDLCPRFCARVMDVDLGPSPAWLRDRLESVGVRSINNVVDLTNYVMMEMGHPCHAFDLDRIPESRLVVRWGQVGERLTTLDEEERQLTPRIGLVASPRGPLALAGIMGGASSEVSDATTTLALEAAYWEPLAIRRGARALGMHTEASHRFERGADPEGPVTATARFAHLLQKIGGGQTRPGLIDSSTVPRPRRSVVLRADRVRLVLGTDVPEEQAERTLRGLGFGAGPREGDGKRYEVPSWRGDVTREEDLIEEVARHHGLDKIPSTLPPSRRLTGLKPAQVRERAVREVLVGAGLCEVINYGFVSPTGQDQEGAAQVHLENPLAQDQGALRTSLVRPGLLSCLQRNLRQGRRDVRLFELGRVFTPASGLPVEGRRLGLLLAGPARPAHWADEKRGVDLFDAKGILEAVAQKLGAVFELTAEGIPAWLQPGKAAVVQSRGKPIGHVGSLHPDVAGTWELRDETVVAEVALDELLVAQEGAVRFRPLPRFPAVSRDLSILCDATLSAASVEARIRSSSGELLRTVSVVDRYHRPPVPPGKVSLTVTLCFQDPERTLTGERVRESMERVIQALQETGAEIRGV